MKQVTKNNTINENDNVFYTVTMRGLVAFPNMVMHFDVAREKSIKAIRKALEENGKIFLIAQKEAYIENPKVSDLYKIGVVAEIRQVLRLPDNVMKVLVKGLYKARLVDFIDNEETLMSVVKRVPSHSRAKLDPTDTEALMRSAKNAFEKYASFFPKMPQELISSVMTQETPEKLFELITFNCTIGYREKQELLEETNLLNRLAMLVAFLNSENEILEIEYEINEQTQENMDKNQK